MSPLANTFDRMRWALVMCGATDHLRADLRPEAVARAARRCAAALTAAVGPGRPGEDPDAPLAERLAARLATHSDARLAPAVNAALVLLADHELATSTMAVRIAASVRADPYDALRPGWPPWPARYTAEPARWPSNCLPQLSVTARPAP